MDVEESNQIFWFNLWVSSYCDTAHDHMIVHVAVPRCCTLIKLDVFHSNILVIWIFEQVVIIWLQYNGIGFIWRFSKRPKCFTFIHTIFTEYHMIIKLNRVTQDSWCESWSNRLTSRSAVSVFKNTRYHSVLRFLLAQRTTFLPRCPWRGLLRRTSRLVFRRTAASSNSRRPMERLACVASCAAGGVLAAIHEHVCRKQCTPAPYYTISYACVYQWRD